MLQIRGDAVGYVQTGDLPILLQRAVWEVPTTLYVPVKDLGDVAAALGSGRGQDRAGARQLSEREAEGMRRRSVSRSVIVTVLAFARSPPPLAEPRLFDLELKDGRLPADQRLLRVRQGDDVTLKWTTDRPFTLHLHGYDLEAKLVPQTAVELRFTARATGRFPLEIHGPGTERTVGHLEVHPR